ncbi:hypothetical protein OKW49_001888 [Paraburkholderia youngii]
MWQIADCSGIGHHQRCAAATVDRPAKITLDADKAYDAQEFTDACEQTKVAHARGTKHLGPPFRWHPMP